MLIVVDPPKIAAIACSDSVDARRHDCSKISSSFRIAYRDRSDLDPVLRTSDVRRPFLNFLLFDFAPLPLRHSHNLSSRSLVDFPRARSCVASLTSQRTCATIFHPSPYHRRSVLNATDGLCPFVHSPHLSIPILLYSSIYPTFLLRSLLLIDRRSHSPSIQTVFATRRHVLFQANKLTQNLP